MGSYLRIVDARKDATVNGQGGHGGGAGGYGAEERRETEESLDCDRDRVHTPPPFVHCAGWAHSASWSAWRPPWWSGLPVPDSRRPITRCSIGSTPPWRPAGIECSTPRNAFKNRRSRPQDVRQGVETWARKEATERLASRLEVENKTERLAVGLRQADVWLEISGASLQGVQQALEAASSLGARRGCLRSSTPCSRRLGAVRSQLKQSIETVDAIRERLNEALHGETLEERLQRFAQLALRVVATLGEIDSRLGQFADGIVATRSQRTTSEKPDRPLHSSRRNSSRSC